jgi:GNAT superfamily N-acetyltransferase
VLAHSRPSSQHRSRHAEVEADTLLALVNVTKRIDMDTHGTTNRLSFNVASSEDNYYFTFIARHSPIIICNITAASISSACGQLIIVVNHEWRRQGYGREALAAAQRWFADGFGIRRISYRCCHLDVAGWRLVVSQGSLLKGITYDTSSPPQPESVLDFDLISLDDWDHLDPQSVRLPDSKTLSTLPINAPHSLICRVLDALVVHHGIQWELEDACRKAGSEALGQAKVLIDVANSARARLISRLDILLAPKLSNLSLPPLTEGLGGMLDRIAISHVRVLKRNDEYGRSYLGDLLAAWDAWRSDISSGRRRTPIALPQKSYL